MKRKVILLVGLVLALVLLAPITVWASQTTRRLEPGRVYEFSGTDARIISHVNVSGTNRYEIVSRDGRGEITRFGFAGGHFSVSGTGSALITPLAPISVSFDSSRLTLRESPGTALRQVTVAEGTTVGITNNNGANMHIRTNQAAFFDYAVFNRAGENTRFNREARLPQLSVPGGGLMMITALDGNLVVYFPSFLYDNELEVERLPHPTLTVINVEAGATYEFTNAENTAMSLSFAPETAGAVFIFEHITRGRDGHVVSHGTIENNTPSLAANQSISITPLIDAELSFPYAWLEHIDVSYGTVAPLYHALAVGTSMVVTNDDSVRSHNIIVRPGVENGVFGFDFVIRDEDDVTFEIRDNITTAQSTVSIPPGASVTITAVYAPQPLEVSVPDVDEILAESVVDGALVRHVLMPGRSVYIENTGDYPIDVLPLASGNGATVDFVLYNAENGSIDSFGRSNIRQNITIPEGMSALITSPDYTVTLHFPRYYLENGVSLERRNGAALHRHNLSGGETLIVSNLDRRHHFYFLVQNESNRNSRNQAYEYLLLGNGDSVLDYGISPFGSHIVPSNRRIMLMARDGVELSVAFPAEWYNRRLRVEEVDDEPLYHMVLAPGRSITFTNNTRHNFAIANSSRTTNAGFHTVGPGRFVEFYYDMVVNEGEMVSIADLFPPGWLGDLDISDLPLVPAPPRTVRVRDAIYVPQSPLRLESDTPESGDIIILAGTRQTITAALGHDLEIWMPRSWARILGLI